jgi:hypothetical protein
LIAAAVCSDINVICAAVWALTDRRSDGLLPVRARHSAVVEIGCAPSLSHRHNKATFYKANKYFRVVRWMEYFI